MKTLELKTKKVIDGNGNTLDVQYKDLISSSLNQIDQNKGGLTFEEIEKRLRIKTALDKSNGKLKLEDQDAEALITLVSGMKWVLVDQAIVDFVKDIQAMKATK